CHINHDNVALEESMGCEQAAVTMGKDDTHFQDECDKRQPAGPFVTADPEEPKDEELNWEKSYHEVPKVYEQGVNEEDKRFVESPRIRYISDFLLPRTKAREKEKILHKEHEPYQSYKLSLGMYMRNEYYSFDPGIRNHLWYPKLVITNFNAAGLEQQYHTLFQIFWFIQGVKVSVHQQLFPEPSQKTIPLPPWAMKVSIQ
ncbi:hypothetical protein KI387_006213, partial [Taxus chinensis]